MQTRRGVCLTKAVSRAKKQALDRTYDLLETTEGEKQIYKIAKSRSRARKDAGKPKQVKGGDKQR